MKYKKGFTLVELLIVIALIAILSVAVLATINPIEQANKARDARVMNDAAEVMNAYERYYASKSTYPWTLFTVNPLTAETAIVFRSDEYGFGVCKSEPGYALDANVQVDGCSASDLAADQGELILTSELKSSFVGKDEFEPVRAGLTAAALTQALWTVKAASDDTIYVCWVPKANANRSTTAKNRCITAAGVVNAIGANGCIAATPTNYSTDDPAALIVAGTAAVFQCVPE